MSRASPLLLPQRGSWSLRKPVVTVGAVPELEWPSLADGAVALRPWRAADVPTLLDAFRDPLFIRFNDWAPTTEASARDYLAAAEAARLRGQRIEFAVVDPQLDTLVLGGASLNNVSVAEARAAVGYWLTPGARGRGLATRAVRLIVRWAFNDLHLARLEVTCGPDNDASQRVAERCGFTREGVLRSHVPFKDARRDTVVFGLLAADPR
jgi:[ribosomal protein S5]-alanine N-acetyltransferase